MGINKDRRLLPGAQWARLSPLLPGNKRPAGTTAQDTCLFVEAVLWRARCGVSWRDLPAERFGPWHTVYAGLAPTPSRRVAARAGPGAEPHGFAPAAGRFRRRAGATRFDKRAANYFAPCCRIAALTWL